MGECQCYGRVSVLWEGVRFWDDVRAMDWQRAQVGDNKA